MKGILPHFLSTKIINLLMRAPGLSAAELRRRLSEGSGRSPTLQAVYKELRRLQAGTAVFKSKDRYYLSLPWLLSSQSELNRAIEVYSSQAVLRSFLPEAGASRRWNFSDITAMDRFVVNMLVTLLQLDRSDKTIFHWDPYPWYAVFHLDLAEPFLKEFVRAGFRAYGVLGADSPVSRQVRDSQRRFGHQWWIGEPPFAAREDTAFSVKPPYVLTVRHPAAAVAVFREFFALRSARRAEDFAPFHALHFRKLRYSVTIAHAPAKARRLAAGFRRLFEI